MELKNYFAQDASGNVLPGAQVDVFFPGTTTRASGLEGPEGSSKSNPFFADSKGLISFAAPNGFYDLRVTSGMTSYTIRIQFVDVSEQVAAANAAASSAGDSAVAAANSAAEADAKVQVLRDDLSNTSDPALGAAIVGYKQSPLADPWAVAGALSVTVSILSYIPESEHAAIKAGTSTYDCKAAFDKAMSEYRRIFVPDGKYLLSAPIETDGGEFNGYILQGGYNIIGESKAKTILTRGKTDPSIRVESNTEATYATQAVVNFHGMYHTVGNLTIEESDVGVFYGQNLAQGFDTYVSRCALRNVVIRECGTGISATVANGITYSDFDDVNIYRCQIGARSRDGRWSPASAPYFNRNKFRNVRFSRCWVGLWLKRGDTNTFYSVDAEGVNNDGNIADIPAPTGLPTVPGVVAGVPTKAIAYLVDDAPYNRFFGTTIEACEVRIADYNSSGVSNFNQYYGMQVGESVVDTDRFFFTKPPTRWQSDRATVDDSMSRGSSAYTNIDPEMGSGRAAFKEPVRYLEADLQAGAEYEANLTAGGGFKDTWQHLGVMPVAGTKTVTFSAATGNRNAFDFIEFDFTASDSVGRIGVNLKGILNIAYSNSNNNVLRARVDKPVLYGFSLGGGDAFNDTNTGLVTVAVAIVSGAAQLTFTNASGPEFTGCSIRLRTVRAR